MTMADNKFDRAVDRARGNGAKDTEMAPVTPPSALVGKATETDVAEMLSGKYEVAPQIASLEEGDKIEGILEGEGPMAEVNDPTTGEVREIRTWIIANASGTARVSILTSAQLERKLPPFVGGFVKIVRGKDIKTNGGRRVADYLVGGERLPDGKKRTWARPPMIDATAEAKQLPAGTPETAAAQPNGAAAS